MSLQHRPLSPLLLFTILCLRIHNIAAFAPPDEALLKSSWVPVDEYHRQRGLSSDYEPELLNREVCRYLSDDACQEIDEAFVEQAIHTRAIVQTQHTLKPLVILVQWPDHDQRQLIPVELVDELWNSEGIDETWYPTGSIKTYIEKNSYGRLQIDATVLDWQVTNGTEVYYADYRSGLPRNGEEPELRAAFHHILNQMEKDGFPFADYDLDGDGLIDSAMFIHSGYGADFGHEDCESGANYRERIWSHALGATRENRWVSPSTNVGLGAFAVAPVFRGYCDSKIARIGVMTHEFLHTLGLPDLYDVAGRYSNNPAYVGGLGGYGMMSNPRGQGYRQAYPGSLSPWSKLDLGWIDPIEITHNDTFIARPSQDHPDIFIIREGFVDNEFLLIENRQQVLYDRFLYSEDGGILIYHIDQTDNIRGNNHRGFPGMDGWPGNGKHYPVALLQADGKYELEKAYSNGDVMDFYRLPTQRLGPGNGELEATDEGTYPNTDSYADGIRPTGIVIDEFHEMDASAWSFRVSFPDSTKPPPVTDPCPHQLDIVVTTDRFPYETSWELLGATGHLVASDGDDPDERLEKSFTHEWNVCLPNSEEFTFTVYDSYGDGLCCTFGIGSYTLFLDGAIVGAGGEFEFSDSVIVQTGDDAATTSRVFPFHTSRGRFGPRRNGS